MWIHRLIIGSLQPVTKYMLVDNSNYCCLKTFSSIIKVCNLLACMCINFVAPSRVVARLGCHILVVRVNLPGLTHRNLAGLVHCDEPIKTLQVYVNVMTAMLFAVGHGQPRRRPRLKSETEENHLLRYLTAIHRRHTAKITGYTKRKLSPNTNHSFEIILHNYGGCINLHNICTTGYG